MPPTSSSASAPSRDAALAQAMGHHRAGRLAEAAAAYRALAEAAPGDLRAIHGLGLVTNHLGRPDRALPLLARCIAAEPNNLAYCCGFALVALALGRADAAAVAVLPAANAMPVRAEPRLLLARALGALNRWSEARDIMAATATALPDDAAVWAMRGRCAHACGDLDDAEASWTRAAALDPADADVLNNLGVLLRSRGRLAEAAAAYRAALARAPDNALFHGNLGNLLGLLGAETEAEIHLRRALVLDPGFVDGHYNLGAHLVRIDQPAAAIPHLRRVLALQPERWDALTNLGVALVACGELDEAEACYRRALALKPDNPEAHYDLAWLLLLRGRWDEGWREYAWRWRMPSFSSRRRAFDAPLWDGRFLDGPLLMHAEQGLGDAIQFVRYAAFAARRCRKLVIDVPRPLLRLFAAAAQAGLLPGDIHDADATPPVVAAHVPFMTLPGLHGGGPSEVPAEIPYLVAPPPAPHLRLADRGRRRIGLVWAGSPDNRIDRQRSMPAAALLPLFDATAADFVSLQVGPAAGEVRVFPQDRIGGAVPGAAPDFLDTAAVIAQLDLVIGVDTAVMHLAGALGKPGWLLLPAAPDYRWLESGATTAWYPSLRLFRQAARGDWAGVIAAVARALTIW